MKRYSLVGVDGNAYSLMGYTQKALKENGKSKEDIDKIMADAMSGDYDHLICVLQTALDDLNYDLGFDEDDGWDEDEEYEDD